MDVKNPSPSLATPVAANLGGTGLSTLTAHGVLIGNAASTINVTAAGTAGQPLLSGGAGADPAFAATLSIPNGGTGQTTAAAALAALGGLASGGIGTILAAFQTSAETVTNSATLVNSTQCILALAPGTYDCESWEMTGSASIVAFSQSVLAFSGTASQTGIALIRRAFSNNPQAANESPVISDNTAGTIAYNTIQVNFGTNVALVMWRKFRLVVTVAGNLTIQFSEVVATPATSAILYAGSYLTAIRVA